MRKDLHLIGMVLQEPIPQIFKVTSMAKLNILTFMVKFKQSTLK